jgi:glycosyltransferase involved in cell wall biosynthesis
LSSLDSESFGVAVVEASACEIPVVVSDVGGLPEVVENNISGFIVKSRDPEAAAIAIEKLILSKSLRLKMGNAGRERVLQNYNWTNNVTLVIEIYNSLIY